MQTWEKIIKDPSLLDGYLIREKVIDVIRSFFKGQSFHEVFTPTLVPTPSCEPNLEVFETKLKTLKKVKRKGYLIMSPEFSIKKLLASGIGNCFEIARCFRNEEEVSSLHNPEFTMLEWYRINADYTDVMNDFEQLFINIVNTIKQDTNLKKFRYQNNNYDISLPWLRISVSEAFEKYAKVNIETLISEKGLIDTAKQKGYKVDSKTSWEEVFYQIIFNEIEPQLNKLKRPYFFYDYPLSQASLSKRKTSDPRFAERFEVFLAGIELGNCFSELTDAKEQRSRFTKDLKVRRLKGKSNYPLDKQLIRALTYKLPEMSGIAVGVDRLIMLISDSAEVSDTLFFPAKELFDLDPS